MSRGPEINAPKTCPTIELKDLADVQDFEKNAEVGEVYAFEYTNEGYYKRKAVDDEKRPRNPKLEQLRNVEIELPPQDDVAYYVTHKGNKWHFKPSIDWLIKFEFISPYTFYSLDKTFRKAINAGPIHMALVYESASIGELEVLPIEQNARQYKLHRKDTVTKPSTTKIRFLPNFTLNNQYTMMFVLSITVERESFLFMTGIDIDWKDLTDGPLRFAIVIQNDGTSVQANASNNKVNLNVTPDQLTTLSSLNLQHTDLIAFYYTDAVLSGEQLRDFVVPYQ